MVLGVYVYNCFIYGHATTGPAVKVKIIQQQRNKVMEEKDGKRPSCLMPLQK